MAERRISYALDVENGDHARNPPDVNEATAGVDEYTALNRYISTARDGRRGSASSAGAASVEKKKPWWKFWKKADTDGEEGFILPEEWLETDMSRGISASDVEPRRKRSGWNELSTEKENFFIQFIGYFRGPILYGMYFPTLSGNGWC
jgi:H+-transporting ATPase